MYTCFPSREVNTNVVSTTDGPNDQSNYDATFTVGPILRKIKPRVATLEQTLGIVTNKQHHKTFLTLLCEIGHAGYDLRYKRWVFSELGLAQNRKRLVVIAARYLHCLHTRVDAF